MQLGVDGLGTTGLGGARIQSTALVMTGGGVIELSGTSIGNSTSRGDLSVITPRTEPALVKQSELATAAHYQLVGFPLFIGSLAYMVVSVVVDPASGGVWGVAVVLITAFAMHDREFSKLVKKIADYLQPPQ